MRASLGVLFSILIAGAAIASACGGDSKTVSVPGGGQVSVSDKLPDSFPKDYPIYGGAKVKGSLSGTTTGITGTTVTWETGDSLSKVADFYSNAFSSGAWKSEANGQSGDSSYWTGQSSDGKKAHYLLVSTQNGKTSIIATVGDKPADSSSSSSSSKTAAASSDSSDSGSSSSPQAAQLPAEVKVSKDFPTDRVPLPSGARVTSSSSFGSGNSKTYSVELYVKDTPEKVSDYFAAELPKRGWTSAFTSNSNGDYFLTFSKEGAAATASESVTVSASASDVAGYTRVDLLVNSTAN